MNGEGPSAIVAALGKVIADGQGKRKALPLPMYGRQPANSPQWTMGQQGDQSGQDGCGERQSLAVALRRCHYDGGMAGR